MAKKNFYAVAKGRKVGIYASWSECEQQIKGYPKQMYQGFKTREEAKIWLAEKGVLSFAAADGDRAAETDDMPPWENDDYQAAHSDTQNDEASPICESTKAAHSIILHPDHSSAIEPETDAFCKQYGFDSLSTDQRRAVQSVNGNVLLFAVPGSGKTTVLIARTGYMIHSCGIAPGQIVSLTFTKASADEMAERYRKCFPQDTVFPEFRTIHSFAFSVIIPLLKNVGFSIPRHLISEVFEEETKDGSKRKQSYSAAIFGELNHHLRAIAQEKKEGKVVLLNGRKDREALQTAITGIKNTRMREAELSGRTIRLNSGQDLPIDRAFKVYLSLCRKYHCMDFDDMMSYALEGLQQHPDVLMALQKQYRYWSIDESQDNSPLQHDLLRLLAGESGNLFMVGDDDQSIYAFRGAKPRRFQEFGMEAGVKVLTMGTNYRSASGIVKTAETFIRGNISHQDKQMQAFHTELGCVRFIYDLHRERHQYERIVKTAAACRQQGKELAVLYRENISALPVMFWLENHGIPFFTAAKLSELLQNPYVSRILNLMRFIVKQNSYKLCAKVRTELNIFLSDEELAQWKRVCNISPERNVLEVLDEMSSYDYSSTLQALSAVASAPYKAIQDLMQSFGIHPNSQSEKMQVNAILSTAMLYDTIPEMLSAIDTMKRRLNDTSDDEDNEETAVPVEAMEQQAVSGNGVTLTTMHGAKGLEFDHVIIIDFLTPPNIPFDPMQLIFDDPEELRRLFYVAITRAKQALDILTVQSYHGVIVEPHSFIREYASICEQAMALTEYAATAPKADDCVPVKTYGKYYGVPVGRTPGVYNTWDEAKAQTEHFSIKPNEQPKGFSSWDKAAAYAYPNGIPDAVRPVDTSILNQYLVTNPILPDNWPQDIHPGITNGILKMLKTDSLQSLDQSMISKLRMDYLSSHDEAFDYSGTKALAYAVNYLPLNYYKIWAPLWKLLEKKRLPYQARVLELGAGPGTSGLALLDFYSKLATANPGMQFCVDYTAIEREQSFLGIMDHLWKAMIPYMPKNLHISQTKVQADVFAFMSRPSASAYDLILESNMLNPDEGISDKNLRILRSGIVHGLREHGYTILIEPGKQDQEDILAKAVSDDALVTIYGPSITSVDISAISLVKQCLQAGLRYKAMSKHWYSMVIAERKAL